MHGAEIRCAGALGSPCYRPKGAARGTDKPRLFCASIVTPGAPPSASSTRLALVRAGLVRCGGGRRARARSRAGTGGREVTGRHASGIILGPTMGTAIHTFRQVVPSAGCMLHPRRRGSCRARERGSGGPEPKDSRGLWVWAGRTGMDEGGGGWMLTLSRSWCTACQQFRHPWPRHPPGTSGPGRGTEQEPGKPGNHRRGSKKPPQQVAACDGRLGLGAAVTKGLRHSARMAGRERCGRDWDVTAARQRPPRRRGQTRGQAHVGETVIRLVRYDRSAPGSQGASRHRRT